MDETPIEVVSYDPEWRDRFDAERDRLRPWLDDFTTRIEHVGSTSVPGLAAKPVVDALAVVDDLPGLWGDVDKLHAALGYELSHLPRDWLFLQRADGADRG
ncbi:GrpB family protein [Halobacterium wangiae]|uniref:GrpB family protein n=1 Tax=Halobacterium wangiae TaxID=2902623 RepID=UPI003D7BA1CD